jgi:hypothetical protein
MMATLRLLLEGAVERLAGQITTYGPGMLAAATILLVSWLLALGVRWTLNRIFKGITLDRFLRESGIAAMLDHSGRLRATHLVSNGAYWIILLLGGLTALNTLNTDFSARFLETLVQLFPKLFAAGLILLAGAWLGRYLSRGVLVWAVNENFPGPRKLAAATRAGVMFVAVVVAADHLNFARSVFLAAFVLLLGGVVIAAALAFGLGGRDAVRHYLEEPNESELRREVDSPKVRSLWNHL